MNTIPTTEQRLARLETQSRRWKLAAVGLAGLVIGGLVVGFGPPRADYQPIDDAFLDYLEAGGVFPVPKLVGITQTGNQMVRLWSNGEIEALHTPGFSPQFVFAEGSWIPQLDPFIPEGDLNPPLEALAWHPVNVEP